MDKLKLDLGQFNQCVSYASRDPGMIAYPTANEISLIFYFTRHLNNDIISRKVINFFNVPIFDIGAVVKDKCINDPEAVKALLAKIELEVFNMIRRLIQESGSDLKFENVLIPIKSVNACNDDFGGGCYGWVEIGIAVIVPAPIKVKS